VSELRKKREEKMYHGWWCTLFSTRIWAHSEEENRTRVSLRSLLERKNTLQLYWNRGEIASNVDRVWLFY